MIRWVGPGAVTFLALFLALAGCDRVFGLSRPIDAPPPVDAPPDARVCAPSAVTPPGGDLDLDGLINVDDNCPTAANPDQHDEDNDCVGDPCDPCPWLAIPTTTSADADRLADECDWQPATTNQVFYESFYSSEHITMFWRHDGWLQQDDRWLQHRDAGFHWSTADSAATEGHAATELVIPQTTIDDGRDFSAGLEVYVDGFDPTSSAHGFFIGVARDTTGTWLRVSRITGVVFTTAAQTKLVDEALSPIPLTVSPIRVAANATAGSLVAWLVIGGREFSLATTPQGISIDGEYFGLLTVNTPATFEYFALVRN